MKPTLEDVVRPDMVVGGYRIEKKLGAGGFGKVFLAWRDGSPCALKFIHLESVGEWGWRELFIMLRHEFPNVVKLLSHFKWPEEKPEYLVLVMEYVPGVTLYQWARDNNPCARELVEKLLPLARALKAVHSEEVFHRDLKGDNVLVREADGAPVLVDFGAGTMPGVPRVTGALAPANLRYRSPEAVAFFLRENRKRGESYDYLVGDELYALGVILYVLATDVYPFNGPDDELMAEILAGETKPPHVRNSRVPRALSELCLRLLAKANARVPDAEALCVALEKLLEEAKADPRWEVPLCYGWTVDGRTTEDAPELVGHDPQAWLRRWIRQKPKRGRPPAPPAPPVVAPAPPEPPTASTVSTLRTRVRRAIPVLVAVTVVGLVVGVGFFLGQLRPTPPAPTPPPVLGQPVLASPVPAEFSLDGPTPWATRVHEVAPPWKPPEADAGAAPPRAETPASVTTVTLSSGTTRMKKKAPGSQAEKEKKGNGSTGANVLLAVAAAANMACPGAQVRKAPAPQACPTGAVETMTRQLGLEIGERHGADMPGAKLHSNERVSVKEGPVSLELKGGWKAGADAMGRGGRVVLPDGTRLSGQLCIGEKRVYGRITQAVTPTGDTFTICMELYDQTGDRGVEIEPDGGVIKVFPRVEVMPVERFE
ncbi:serine/threonine-protein kinase [Archangium sp.]|uniref:serine/threonine protein kinase n=1 Tax=Archangium sp. TaxID=1872627 RepID=UPI002D472958|nr:serine/threonine-protein kinase [Archangium sp.]HYO58521.1 serine/threonine-protein kinase [Archangium sp.]